ncbi:hypothetical protein UE98_19365 [Burkholderia cenocepacia]|nr:hypothetical protein UE98_19365 [Burkholderia cenocepacia]
MIFIFICQVFLFVVLYSNLATPSTDGFDIQPYIHKRTFKFYTDLVCQVAHFIIVSLLALLAGVLALKLINTIKESFKG